MRIQCANSFLALCIGQMRIWSLWKVWKTERFPPRMCANCGRYFLQAGGYDTEYCDNIALGETAKTCKDVGTKNTFDQKVKTNPVWQLHRRAYKTHYARMKKKT